MPQICSLIIKTKTMRRYFETILFLAVLITISVYSKTISIEVVEQFNNCIEFMAGNTSGINYFSF